MRHVAILAFDGCYASIASGFADLLQVANAHLRRQDGARFKPFDWSFVSHDGANVRTSSGLLMPTRKPKRGERFDVVFVPAFHYTGQRNLDKLLLAQQPACDWLRKQWEKGSWLAANCTGTFVLARTGLLDDTVATTTWWLEPQFRDRFPRVDLKLHLVLTEGERLLCAGASASYLLQAIRVIETCSGPSIATQSARSMLIDVSQTTQWAFFPLLTGRKHADSLVQRAQDVFSQRMTQEIRIADVAEDLAVSERTLIRRFKAALDQAPLTYLQHLRIDAARSLLESGDLAVDQIATRVGYSDTSSFSRLFRRRMGLSPGAYRDRVKPP